MKLDKLFEEFSEEEKLDKDNLYRCENCREEINDLDNINEENPTSKISIICINYLNSIQLTPLFNFAFDIGKVYNGNENLVGIN